MEATMILAEAVTIHPDGTFSMLRGGISHAWGQLPLRFKGAVLVHFRAELSENGPHEWGLCMIDQDGKDVMPRVQGSFQVPPGGGSGSFAMDFICSFSEYGECSLRLTLGRQEEKRWNLHVTEAEKPTNEEA